MSELYSYASVSFGGVDMPIESIDWEKRAEETKERLGVTYAAISGTVTVALKGFAKLMRDLVRKWPTPKQLRRSQRRERAWYRREAQRVFQRACRAGVRLNASAADVVRVLRGWRP